MSSNEKAVTAHYRDTGEEHRATESRYAELEFYYTKKHISHYIGPLSSVIELGCGTGYYAMYFSAQCKTYVGVDLTPENIELLNQKAAARGLKNVTGVVGDATTLNGIPSASFDVVLCLGPLYHLPPNERKLVFAECHRICKSSGIAVFAYISKVGAYAGACIHDDLRANYPNAGANRQVLQKGTDDLQPGLFFYTMPEEIELVAAAHGFAKIKNLGTDFFITKSVVDAMSDEKFALLRPLLDQMAFHESCTGMSNHAVLVCQKSPPSQQQV